MPLELEEERPGVWPELRVSIGLQYEFGEGVGIEKVGVHLPCARAIASMFRIGGNREFFPHFEAHLKIFWNLRQIPGELVCGRGAIKSCIITYRAEERLASVEILTKFSQAFTGKGCLRVFPCIDLSLPALIGPGGGSKANEGRKWHVPQCTDLMRLPQVT